MFRFHAGLVVILTRDLSNEVGLLSIMGSDGQGDVAVESLPSARAAIADVLSQLLADPAEMPVSQIMRGKIERLRGRAVNDNNLTVGQAALLLKELHNDLLNELTLPYFLMIPTEWRHLYEQKQPLFGDEVEAAFPSASYDIAAAGRCIALDEWTATVFHLMRAAEHALRLLARRLKIKKVETKDWATLIDDVDKALMAMRQRKRTAARDRRLQYYSQARAHFGVFKDAWRNHVMHSHARYDQREAANIFSSVKSLMEELARGVPR
jgi:HEPN domain-containing protein